ncbi:hypothetical protein AALP_AA8G368900 [Arabis alpina]|uniref:Uncharacterized protein n=1 Tax=Arabis alpina TaxID=50452 RepID=A0A087GBS6_ARAAL|nr:hypothetical protein AALP_AA8G368900 [Arabis alpina]
MMNQSQDGGFTPLNPNPFEDPKVRLRHHSLMQDYQELHMETEAMRKKLQTIRERKATLMSEVRFLRRRYRHLKQDQPQDIKKVRGKTNGGKKSKTQIRIDQEVSPSKKSDAETKHVSLPDLNESGKVVNDETKTDVKRKVPLFDLNQISGEEEEETEEAVNNDQERTRVEEESSLSKQKEMKLSSCRNGGNNSSSSNKRKISWQDPVSALKV